MSEKIFKLTHPLDWAKSVQGLKSNYIQQTPFSGGVWDDNRFVINQEIDHCDVWVVHGDLDRKSLVWCKGPTVFVLSEEVDQKVWNKEFLNQFDMILGSQADVDVAQYKRGQYLCPWQIDKSYDELTQIKKIQKPEVLSGVISDSTFNIGHKKRFAFVNQLKGHFKKDFHWYGRGNLFIENKWDGLAKYKYSIAIENSAHPHYWTEKIADCFLAWTVPVYYGCTNIGDYFPKGSFIEIDIHDLERSIAVIEDAIKNNWHEKNYNALVEARRLVLEEYQFFPCLLKQLGEVAQDSKYRKVTLYPEGKFLPKRDITCFLKRGVEKIITR